MSDNVKKEIDNVIKDLESRGIDVNSHLGENTRGLGDVVEETLKRFGITEEKFKKWFNLNECNCTKRKKWLNGLFSWTVYDNKKKP